ncbi:MAG: CDP-alcohol phosphatidyltransferase family protein [Rhodospirillaceae bacterium]|jgi:CDP-diacylglycerol--serine O-phosphatidyltransferase
MTANTGGEHDQQADQRPRQTMSFNKLFPNMLTVLALCSGLTAIRFSISEDWESAVIALVIACFLDGIDGLAARLLRGTTKFGAELDSLSDAISFGMVPSIMLYLWAMQDAGTLGWALCLLYAVCCVLRLARFNTMVGDPGLPSWAHNYFTGVPSPAAAGLAILPMILSFYFDAGVFNTPTIVGLFLATVSFLMVSKVPTFSVKKLRVPRQFALPMMIFIALFAGFMVTETWATLGLMGLVYLGSIPFSVFTFMRLSKRGGPTEEELAEAEAED